MSLILVGILYAILFWVAGLNRPGVVMAMICGTIFFQEDLSVGGPVKFALGEINVILAIPLLVFAGRRIRNYPGSVPIAIYLIVCVVFSLLQGRETGTAGVSVAQMVLYLVVVPVVFTGLAASSSACQTALRTVVYVGSGLALGPLIFHSNYVLGLHKNGLGSTLCAAILVAVELQFHETNRRRKRIYTFCVGCISLGLLATFSRGAWLGAVAGLAVLAVWRQQMKRLVQAFLLLLPLLAILWWKLPAESKEHATDFSTDTYNVKARLDTIDISLEQFRSSPITGVGVSLRKEYDATNIILSTLAETGVVGLVAFMSIFIVLFLHLWRARRFLPRRDIASSVVALAFALNVAKLAHGLVDHYWTRGSITLAWAVVGMAAALIPATRRRMALLRLRQEALEERSVPVLQLNS